jgi:glycosyltransferase involved in cell wall biosynthesis
MKRILHISKYYPPHFGGIEDVCYTLVGWLAADPGVEQRVFCFGDGRSSSSDSYEGVRVVRAGSWCEVASQSIAPRYPDRLRREIRSFRPDIVHFHAPNPLAAACLLAVLPRSTKLIVHWHSDILVHDGLYRVIRPVESALLRRADVIVTTSEPYTEHSRPLGPFRHKCTVIPNVVNTSKLSPSPELVERLRGSYGDRPLLLFVGRHVPYKGLDSLLGAMRHVEHDCRVVIGGTGPLTERLRSEHTAGNIVFAGRIPDDELSAWYTAADLFMFPSVTKNEAFGVALAEAMWCGTPAITFTIPGSGVNWVNLNGVTGIEVDNRNERQLAAAIDHLLAHDDMRRDYGRAAHHRVEQHMTLGRISPQLESLYA